MYVVCVCGEDVCVCEPHCIPCCVPCCVPCCLYFGMCTLFYVLIFSRGVYLICIVLYVVCFFILMADMNKLMPVLNPYSSVLNRYIYVITLLYGCALALSVPANLSTVFVVI